MQISTGFTEYADYGLRLSSLARASWKPYDYSCERLAALNGESTRELRKLVDLSSRRAVGAFFTGTDRALEILKNEKIGHDSVVYDPACGSGDLLLAAATKLGSSGGLNETLKFWNSRLLGSDCVEEFLEVTQHRILVLARELTSHTDSLRKKSDWCRNITLCDSVAERLDRYRRATHVFMNPPYHSEFVSESCEWASGSANKAAMFVEVALREVRSNTRIVAILPEVLRTGSRYKKWRELIASYASRFSVESIGLFDANTDVDVFVLRFTKSANRQDPLLAKWKASSASSDSSLGESFHVSVGSVVPFRLDGSGKELSFIHPKNVLPWGCITRISERIRFQGTSFTPPFVVIRRTSRPGDKFRAVGTLILGKRAVAVENHLLVCAPKSGEKSDCEKLLKALKKPRVTEFLDSELRCRHLTVGAVRSIPLLEVKFSTLKILK